MPKASWSNSVVAAQTPIQALWYFFGSSMTFAMYSGTYLSMTP